MEGGKLDVVVSVDVDCSNPRIQVKGTVDSSNVQALYAVARRAAVLGPEPAIVLDLSGATATTEALADLQAAAAAHTLPSADGLHAGTCRLTVTAPAKTTAAAGTDMALAA